MPERRDYSGPGGPARAGGGGGEYRGAPRRDAGSYGDRGPRYGGGYGGRSEPQERGPYDSPYYTVTFYPEDTSFNTLVQTIRKSCRTIELFEIARTVVAKTDRFVVVVTPKTAPRAAESTGGENSARPAGKPFSISLPDGIPFESEEAAIAHVLSQHLDKYFDSAEVEVDPPKGNFQVINRCGVTGELLGPPNYHRYTQIVQQHYAAKASRVPFEAFKNRIETVRDPEVVNQWLAKMKKTTRYTWKQAGPAGSGPAAAAPDAPASPAPGEEEGAASSTDSTEGVSPAPTAPTAPAAPSFDNLEDVRMFLLTQFRDKIVRTTDTARFHGKVAELMPPGEIRHAVEGALERQRRFPLDTANALRGRLRREHFTIFKKGSKGVSYVCAVKRKFRVPGQTFADTIGALISFIEGNPMVRASELPAKLLRITMPAPVKAGDAPAGSDATTPVEAPKAEPVLTIDERAKLSRLQGDLVWLVREGYVTEFIDGRLFAPPPMIEARKKEVEAEDHDPENFPEAPPSSPTPEPLPTPKHLPTPEPLPTPEAAAPLSSATEPSAIAPSSDAAEPEKRDQPAGSA